MKPIHILGGGLAGLALGIGLRARGVPVRISEAGSYPRHRVCGEFISGVGASTLESLGLNDVFEDAMRCSSLCWHDDKGTFFQGRLPVPAFGISRKVLDERLAEKFQAVGGELRCGVREQASGAEGEVIATGRRSGKGAWVGIKKHFEGLKVRADLEMQLLPCGYIGFSRIDEKTVNVCGLLRAKDVAGLPKEAVLETLLMEHAGTIWRERMKNAAAVRESACAVAGFHMGWQKAPKEAGLSLGDRTAMIPPFTGHGMAMAFESAALVLDDVTDFARGGLEWKECRSRAAQKGRMQFAGRLRAAGFLHAVLLSAGGRKLVGTLGRRGVLPFQTLLQWVR